MAIDPYVPEPEPFPKPELTPRSISVAAHNPTAKSTLPSLMAIEDGLVHHWSPSVEGSLSNVSDLVGSLDMTLGGTSAVEANTEGNGSYAVRSNPGSANKVTCNPMTTFIGATTMSISCWAKRVAYAGNSVMNICGVWSSSATYCQWMLDFTGSGYAPEFRTSSTAGIATFQFTPTTEEIIDDWFHVVLSWEAPSDPKLWINGVEHAKFGGAVRDFIRDVPTYVMDWGGDGSVVGDFDGYLDSLRLYDRALTEAEALELYAGGRGEDFGGPPTFNPAWANGSTQVIQRTI